MHNATYQPLVNEDREVADVRLEVGTAVLRGEASKMDTVDAIRDFARRAVGSIDLEKYPIRCALLFATADWCRAGGDLPCRVRDALEEISHERPPLIGGSMAMLFCSTEDDPLVKHGLVLVLLSSDDIRVSVEAMEAPHRVSPSERTAKLRRMAEKFESRQEIRLGVGSERYLLGILPGFFFDAKGDSRYGDGELHQEILAAFDYRFPLIGASAADAMIPKTGFQFADDHVYESGLALALVENGLSFGAALGHGFCPVDTRCLPVEELADDPQSGYDVSRLDGQPTQKRLQELKQQDLTPHGRPILGLMSGADYRMLIPVHDQKHRDRFIRFNRKVSRGESLYVLNATPAQMLEADRQLLETARQRAGVECEDVSAVLVLSCVGRFRQYETDAVPWDEAARAMCQNWSASPLIGVLGSGEFGVDAWRESRTHNLGSSVCCLGRLAARPSRTGDLQNKLLEWADRLAACQNPEKVMETALSGAVAAGAWGGQFCIVDNAIGRILGNSHGCAVSPPKFGQDWPFVLSKTNRKVPARTGGRFPRALRDWSLPVRHGVNLTWSDTAVPNEDILTLIVRTLQAVYVPDPQDDRFQCRKELARKGNIRAFLAIPLVGSKRKAIATLQLSFPDGALSDRDVFGLWVGYGQKVGAALERTQEAEERSITTNISAFGNELMQDTAALKAGPYAWCDCFLEHVTRELNADAAHIRLLQPSASGEEYRLVGAVGRLGELRRHTRPVTSEGHGSCNRQVLADGGYFTNTREETAKRNADVRPISAVEQYGSEFNRELAKVQATALLPIYHRRELLGSFVIDSSRAYFFTERWRRIVKAAAETAGALLCGRTAAYDNLVLEKARQWQDREKQWMVETMISATQADADECLSQLLKRLCEQLEADVGSVYVWHPAGDRLVLHTTYNWYEPLEGKASYALGQGWTGALALNEKPVSFVSGNKAPAETGSKRYYKFMVPAKHRVSPEVRDPRIGVRLSAGSDLVGVVTFSYYREHDDRLVEEDERFVAFLNAMTGLITLAVERALEECVQREEERLRATMNTVAGHLIAASQPGASWQEVMDDIRTGFQVERVSLYHFQDGQVKHGWSSTCEGGSPGDSHFGPVEPAGAMAELIDARTSKARTFRAEAEAEQMEGWPSLQDVRYVAAFPVLDTQQTVRGVLEFVNRIPSREHPFEAFDKHERIAAENIGRILGAAIDHRDQWQAKLELRSQLATAAKIGASSLSGAIVMHRLLAPYGSIQRAVDSLEVFEDRPDEKRAEALRDIRDACRQAEAVIQNAAQRDVVARERIRLRTIVNQAMKAVQTEIRSPRVNVRLDIELAAVVEVNVFSIVGALVNLLSNAADAMCEEGVLTVATHLDEDRRHAVIQIHNTGPSLTVEEITKSLAVGASGKKGPHHLGLGLPLARRAIEDAGGRLKIHSPSRGGVEAVIRLPLADLETVQDIASLGDERNGNV